MPNSRSTSSGVIELIEGYDMTRVYRWHRPHLREWQARGGDEKWKPLGILFGDIFRCGRESDGGGLGNPKKALFSLSRCAKTQPCCSIPFSRSVKTISGFREESVYSVAWFTGVTPCSHRANPLFSLQNGLHIFPVTQALKRYERKSRGEGEPLLLYLDLHAVSCSAGLKQAVWQLRHRPHL